MKKQLLFLALLSGLVISGCHKPTSTNSESSNSASESTSTSLTTSEGETTSSVTSSTSTSTSTSTSSSNPSTTSNPSSNPTSSSTSNPNTNTSSSSSSSSQLPPPPVIVGTGLEEALKKDYSNMTVEFALNSEIYGEESGVEYYCGKNNFVAVLNSNAAQTMGYERAWDFYCFYEGESYTYWGEEMDMQTTGWISTGSQGTKLGIDKIYFYMPYFLNVLTENDAESVLGSYVVKESSIEKIMGGLKFLWTNDITYIDFFINEDGYISRIRGFDDPNDDSIGFAIKLSNFGITKTPESINIPPEINESNIKTYADMLGHEEEPNVYIESMTININETVESDEQHQIVMYPDDSVDVSFSYLPANANKKEVHWHTSNEDVVELIPSFESGHQYLRAVSEGEAEIYVTHINGDKQTITSEKLKVKVNAPKQVEQSAQDVYRFQLIDAISADNDGHYDVSAVNTIAGSKAPFDITTWRVDVRDGRNSDNFADTDVVFYSAPNSQTNAYGDGGFQDSIFFDFANQQVNKISFSYAMFRCNSKNSLSRLESVTILTSNDGSSWATIDVTDEVRAEFEKASLSTGMSPKVMSKTFLPASMVKVVLKANQIGGYDLAIGLKDFVFSADENCANFDDVDAVPVTSIVASAPRDRLKIGSSMKLTAKVNPEDASNKNVRWVSENPEIVSIDSRTGLVTALDEGSAQIYAVSTTNSEMISNKVSITTYSQETIGDLDNIFIGKVFYASDVMSGNNKYNVTFTVKDETTATLILALDLGLGQPIELTYNLVFDHYDYVSEIYEFVGTNGEFVTVKLAADGSYIELTYRATYESDYTFGDAASGIILSKVK